MSQKAYIDIMCGHKDSNIRFSDVQKVFWKSETFSAGYVAIILFINGMISLRGLIFSQLEIKPKLIR